MNKLNKEGINLPIAAMFAAIQEIKKQITECAKALNILDGAYLLRINKAIKISNPEKNKISKSAIEYIQNSQHVAKNSSGVLFRKGNTDILIEKLHTEKQYVGTVGPTITRWEGESNEEIYALLKERIVSKAKKLNVVSLPKILILLDRYHIADHDQYRKAILKIPEKSKFDIVFFVGQEYEGISLYGEESFLSHI